MVDTSDGSDKATNGAATENQGAGQEGQAAPPLVVHIQYLKDLSLEIPGAPEIFQQQNQKSEVKFDLDVKTRQLAENTYEVALYMEARGYMEAKGESEDQTIFLVEIVYCGVFSLNDVPQEQLRPLLLIECPRLLFPFARGIVAKA